MPLPYRADTPEDWHCGSTMQHFSLVPQVRGRGEVTRSDRVTNVCEMKYSINDFVIDKEYADQLRNKMESFRMESGTRNALHLTMVTTYGVKPNMYSNLVQSEVTLDDLFA